MAATVPAAIAAAKTKIGAPYVWGAIGPSTFDCSGLTQWAWKQAGVDIPRTSQQQAKYGTPVQLKDIRPGDLVTSDWGSGPSSHVALYIGDGKLIHAPRPGKTVTYAKLDDSYARHINAIRRVPGATGAPAGTTGPGGGAAQVDFDWGSINPFSPEYWAQLARGGAAAGSSLAGSALAPLGTMAEGMVGIARGMTNVGAFAEFLMKLALPSTWVRAVCGTLGVGLVVLVLVFLVKETRGM